MPLNARDAASLRDILDAAGRIEKYVQSVDFQHYLQQPMLRDAVERCLEIIGEAARRLSESFRDSTPEVPWRRIMASRNILAHAYDAVANETVWRIATVHVPELVQNVQKFLPPPPPDPDPDAKVSS